MAAGRGTRMDPFTRTRPKVLLPVAGKPIVEHLLRNARAAGFRHATLIVHEGASQVRSQLGDGDALGLDIDYVKQGEPRGTGHAVAALRRKVQEDFVLASGDSVLSADDLKTLRKAKGNAVAARKVKDASMYGLLKVRNGSVQGIVEKKAKAGAGMANAGAYRFEPDIIARCAKLSPSPRGEVELTDAITGLARDGAPARMVETPSWREAGRPWDLLDLQAHLMAGMTRHRRDIAGDVGQRVDIAGPAIIEAGARVLNGCRIEGPVFIGAGARVGPNAYLRGPVAIGPGAHVGNGCEIKGSILMENANVPHLSYVGDSVLGAGCNLGAGTQVANLKHSDHTVRVHWQGKQWLDTGRRKFGALVGDGAKTGVNVSLNPGTVLGPGAVVKAGTVVSGWIEGSRGPR